MPVAIGVVPPSRYTVTVAPAIAPEMLNDNSVAVLELLATVFPVTVCPPTEIELICGAGGAT